MGAQPSSNDTPAGAAIRTADLDRMWCSNIFQQMDLDRDGEVAPNEIKAVIRACPDNNPLCDFLKEEASTRQESLSKWDFCNLFSGYIKVAGDPDEFTYRRLRIYEMKSIQKTIFKAMDVEGKGKLEVKDLRTYMDFVKDPYNIIRTFAQRYNYMKISQEEYMDAVNTYVENHGTPRKCHIEDVREDLIQISAENRRRMVNHLGKAWNQSCGLLRGFFSHSFGCGA
eukprot:jgi/Bigna1/143402/aug1.78_g18110